MLFLIVMLVPEDEATIWCRNAAKKKAKQALVPAGKDTYQLSVRIPESFPESLLGFDRICPNITLWLIRLWNFITYSDGGNFEFNNTY